MGKSRIEAFSDGVIAIIITIMVLELKVPHDSGLDALWPLLPLLGNPALSYHFDTLPVALYGVLLFLAGAAYYLLCRALIAHHGNESSLALAIGRDHKGIVSLLLYLVAIGLAFVHPGAACAVYVLVAAIWFIPDRRIETRLGQ